LFFWLKLYDVKCQNYQINLFDCDKKLHMKMFVTVS
jgi:hypothetical protein